MFEPLARRRRRPALILGALAAAGALTLTAACSTPTVGIQAEAAGTTSAGGLSTTPKNTFKS